MKTFPMSWITKAFLDKDNHKLAYSELLAMYTVIYRLEVKFWTVF